MADINDDSLTKYVTLTVAGAAVTLIGILSRAVFGDVKAKMKEVAERVEGVGRRNDESNREQIERLERISEQVSENRTYRATNDLRLGHLERDVADVRRIVDDHTGFLQSEGFRKRDGRKNGGDE